MKADEILALGFSRKKPSKVVAFQALCNVLEALEQDKKVSTNDLEALAAFFKPSVPKKPKTAEQWVATAINPDDIRPQLRYVYYDAAEKAVVGTNGHILFLAHGFDYGAENQFFEPATMTKMSSIGMRYPDYKKLVLDVKLKKPEDVPESLSTKGLSELEFRSITYGNKVKPLRKIGRRWFDEGCLRKAVAFGPMVISGFADSGALHLKTESGDRLAIVMPIRV